MIEHKSAQTIQECGVGALLHLTRTDLGRTKMVVAKGAECVCWAMREFVMSVPIQINGSSAL
jgi:hypothetical protein